MFDFDGVFTDNKVYVDERGVESVRCDRSDGLAIDMLRRYRERARRAVEFFVLSTERNPVVEARARKMRLDVRQNVGDKLRFMTEHLRGRGLGDDIFAGVVYLGNDLNDLAVLERAGFSVVPDDAHPRIKAIADAVLPQRGGDGFVRAVIEKLLRIDEMTTEEIHELICHR